jgi:hypothetical protein
MYRVLYQGKVIGISKLEAGDPPMGCVSGLIIGISNSLDFSKNLLALGGSESSGEYRIELNSEFNLVDSNDKQIEYSGGQILAYPEINEVLIDVVGIPYPTYEELFPMHVESYKNQFKDT